MENGRKQVQKVQRYRHVGKTNKIGRASCRERVYFMHMQSGGKGKSLRGINLFLILELSYKDFLKVQTKVF